MKKEHPVFITHQDGVSDVFIAAATSGVIDMINLAGISNIVPVLNFGVWKNRNYRANNHLLEYQSIEWFIEMGKKHSTRANQLNCSKILDLMTFEPLRKIKPHYDVCILRQDVYPGNEEYNFVIGVGRRGAGTVVSISRFKDLKTERTRYEVFKTCMMHEFGHVLGLVNAFRRKDVEENLGPHCKNLCVMRQGRRISDFVKITNDRLANHALCASCMNDLMNYFK